MFPICQGRSSGEPTHEPMSLLFSPNISAEMSLDLHQYITLKSANTKKKKSASTVYEAYIINKTKISLPAKQNPALFTLQFCSETQICWWLWKCFEKLFILLVSDSIILLLEIYLKVRSELQARMFIILLFKSWIKFPVLKGPSIKGLFIYVIGCHITIQNYFQEIFENSNI